MGSFAIAWVGAVSAVTAFIKLRRPDETTRPAVRQCFEPFGEGQAQDFGLRNYGPGPALYLQVQVTSVSSGWDLLSVEPRHLPINLREGGFLGLIHDDRVDGNGLLDRLCEDHYMTDGTTEMVHLYYNYRSVTGLREPGRLPEEPERDDATIFEDLKDIGHEPRRMELSTILDHCSNEALDE